jgi:N-carbamoyl-L-amino-acid hydrolase
MPLPHLPLSSSLTINPDRLVADLHRLRRFGAFKTGVHRPTFSPIDIESRHWFADRLNDAGLAADIDGIGNVIGRDPADGPRLLLGSHIETQPQAGWLDGALGVIYALEIARAWRDQDQQGHDRPAPGVLAPDRRGAIDVAAWADEEGYFGSMLGSRSFIGDVTEHDIDHASNRHDGTPLRAALRAAGLEGRSRAQVEAGRYRGYLEAHIEQGDELETNGLRLGVVTGIVGIWQYRIRFEGVQNHAGTTRMAIRRDAGLALVKLAAAIDRRFPDLCGPRSVWTTGRITLDPGAASIIPGAAEMLFQFRDTDPAVLARLEQALQALVEASNQGPCRATLHPLSRSIPKGMDHHFQDALTRAAENHAPGAHQRMPSGAGHDAQQLARVMPAAMLFVPSIGGVSHHWSEDTAEDDIVLGCQVMATAVAELLASGR